MKKLAILTALFALLIGACASAQSSDLSGKSLPGTGTPAPGSKPGEATLPVDAVIEYIRSGGLQGKTETWLIYSDGRVVGSGGEQGTINPDYVTSLLADFNAIGVSSFPSPVPPEKNTCNDCFSYQVTTRSNGEVKTFTAQDQQPDVPPSFWTALSNLEAIFQPQPK